MNVKISVFDVIAYLLPGTVILLSLVILTGDNIYTINNLLDKSADLDITKSILFGAISYILGFAIYEISSKVFRLFDRILPNSKPPYKMPPEEKSKKWVLMREFSPASYNLVNRYDALKSMGQNLIGALSFLSVVSLIKFFATDRADSGWLMIAFLSILLIILLFSQTRKYNYYTALDLNKTIEVLGLEEKAKGI